MLRVRIGFSNSPKGRKVAVALAQNGSVARLVIMDNLGSHKGETVRTMIKAAGARRLVLPPCNADLNAIEQVFAKLKHLLRKAKEPTVGATWQCIGALLSSFQPQECSNCFRHAGYGAAALWL